MRDHRKGNQIEVEKKKKKEKDKQMKSRKQISLLP